MDRAAVPSSSTAASLFKDGLGERRPSADPTGTDTLELLYLRGELSSVPSFEFALRERVSRLSNFRHPQFARVRSVERTSDGSLAIVSQRVTGIRLSELLNNADQRRLGLDITSALCLVRQLVPAMATFHENARDIAHGAIGPERIVLTPTGELTVMEYVVGAALEQLRFTREKYWSELRVALPSSAGLPRFDQRADVTQMGVVALSLILGRPMRDDEYPARIADVVASTWAVSPRGGFEPLPTGLRGWLGRALQLDARASFATAIEARVELDKTLGETDANASQASLAAFLTRYTGAPAVMRPVAVPPPQPATLLSRGAPPPHADASPATLEGALQAGTAAGAEKKQPGVTPPSATVTPAQPPTPAAPTPPRGTPQVAQVAASVGMLHPANVTPARGIPVAAVQTTPPRGVAAPAVANPAARPATSTTPVSARSTTPAPAITPAQGLPRPPLSTSTPAYGTANPAIGGVPQAPVAHTPASGTPRPVATTTPPRGTPHPPVRPAPPAPTPSAAPPPQFQAMAESVTARPAPPPVTAPPPAPNRVAPPALQFQSMAESVAVAPSAAPPLLTPPRGTPPPRYAPKPAASETTQTSTMRIPQFATQAPARVEEEETPKWRKYGVVAAGLVVLAVLGAVAFRQYFGQAQAPAAAGTGTIIFTTNPTGAQVVVDGRVRGVTPITLTVPSGVHKVDLHGPNGSKTVTVSIASGTQIAQYIELPRTPVTAIGQLQVRTEPPGAKVSVDGVGRGTSPMTVADLTPGEHAVVLESDLGSIKQSVTIEAGVTASLLVPLAAPEGAPVSGWIAVTSPVEMQLFEKDRLLGTSRTDRLMVSAGRHDLDIVNDDLGYRVTRTIQVPAGKVAPLKIEMPTGSLAINAVPWAEVWIDGSKVGDTPIGNLTLTIGTHDVVFRHPELGEQHHTATVTLKGVARLSVDLRKQ